MQHSLWYTEVVNFVYAGRTNTRVEYGLQIIILAVA